MRQVIFLSQRPNPRSYNLESTQSMIKKSIIILECWKCWGLMTFHPFEGA